MAAGAAGSYWYAHRSETVATPAAAEQSQPAKADRKILYYRNPMGLPDTSPVPKKDSMGMDYIPVYADEQDDPGTVKVSLDKIQRIGVKTEKVESPHRSSAPCAAVGTVEHDESLLTIVTRTLGRLSSRICSSTRPASTSTRASRSSASTARKSSSRKPTSSSPCAREERWRRLDAEQESRRRHAAIAQSRRSRRAASTRCARPGPIRAPSTGPSPATAT